MSMNVGPCQLHIPHKDWSDDPQEKQNYEAIEQWSYRLPNCFEAAGPDKGGALTLHQATYGWSHGFYGAPGRTWYNSCPANTNLYWDWGNTALTQDAINVNGAFGTDANGRIGWNGDIPVIPIGVNGLLSWHGMWDASSISNGVWNADFLNYAAPVTSQSYNLQQQIRITAGVNVQELYPFGGGYYVQAGTQLAMNLIQYTPTMSVFNIRIMMTLLEF